MLMARETLTSLTRRINLFHCIAAILYTGVILRFAHYFGNRSLWHDEASLATNIINRSFSELLLPLDNMQMAPYGFLVLSKAAVQLLGNNEFALRLTPFIAGCISLYVFRALLRKHFSSKVSLVALSYFSVSYYTVYYSADFKQYSLDILVTISLLFLPFLPAIWSRAKKLAVRMIVGLVVVWCSYPSAFVLAGVGLMLLYQIHKSGNHTRLADLAFCSSVWLVSFYFSLQASGSVGGEVYLGMSDYWKTSFAPFPPTSAGEIMWYPRAFLKLFKIPLGLSEGIPVTLLMVFFYLAGLRQMYRDNLELLIGVTSPIIIALAVSTLHLYPFGERLLLFSVPLMLIVVSVGIVFCYKTVFNKKLFLMVILIVFIGSPSTILLAKGASNLPFLAKSDSKNALTSIAAYTSDTSIPIYVHFNAIAEVRYYRSRLLPADTVLIEGQNFRKQWNLVPQEVETITGHEKIWVLFTHRPAISGTLMDEEAFLTYHLDNAGEKLSVLPGVTTTAYLYQFPPK